jgi:heparan-alpha-glucosaminide N-acetyltransferase
MPNATAAPAQRLTSLDAYRGFVMFLMMAEVLHLSRVSAALPDSIFWKILAFNQSHVDWIGCSLHDLIQPSFSFMVGVALPFSIASRLAKGQTKLRLSLHAFWRAFLLVILGVFLRSIHHQMTYFTFEDTLSQIGLGYGFLFLLGFRPLRDQWIVLWLILVGYWAAFAFYPLPGPGFDYAAVGVPANWPHLMSGFAAHWNMNSNPAWAFDTWFLNLFPREKPFVFNGGGYSTLSFIPTLGTMILGLIAGELMRGPKAPRQKVKWLASAGMIGLVVSGTIHFAGFCPIVKKIWTPNWTIFSGGCCFLLLAGFYLVIDIKGIRAWAFPLIVIGMNSIAAYCMSWLFEGFILSSLRTHLGASTFKIFGPAYETLLSGGCTLLILWSILYWLYKRKIFLKI